MYLSVEQLKNFFLNYKTQKLFFKKFQKTFNVGFNRAGLFL